MSAVYIAIAVVCIVLSALFSASEMALSSANRIRLENAAEDGSRSAAVAVRLIDRFDDTLSAILIGNNFANIALSSVASVIAIVFFEEKYAWLATVIVTLAVIVFGETMPKIVAKKNANRLSPALSRFVRAVAIVLYPLVRLASAAAGLVTSHMRGDGTAEDAQDDAVEELQSIIETAEDEDVIDEGRSELLQAALDFNDVSAYEVMTARVDMAAIDIDDDWDEIMSVINSAPFSRIPVYEDSVDNIQGVLYLNHFFKSLLESGETDIRSLLMEPCYVYKTVRLPAVLKQLKKARQHLAIVTDEYGGTLGLITMEDVLEQLVGEIWDETDVVEDEVVCRSENEYELGGDMPMGEFLETVGREEGSVDADSSTLGGWTLEMFGGFPHEGESFTDSGMRVTVLKMDGLRVERVLVEVLPEDVE